MKKFVALGVVSLALAQPAAAATQIYDLNASDPAAGLGSGPFGTVTVTELGDGSLSIVEQLLAGFRIHDGNANHNALSFSILGDPSLTISNLTAGFAVVGASSGSDVTAPPFGSFFTAIDCLVCTPGYAGGYAGPLSFTVSAANPLSLASLGYNVFGGKNVYFASDLTNANGLTGNVGAVARQVPGVPEPATWAMLLVGFAAIGFGLRRRNQGAGELRLRVSQA